MVEPFANSGESDQTPHSAASDKGLHCLPITLLWVSRLQWVNFNEVQNYKYVFGQLRVLYFIRETSK